MSNEEKHIRTRITIALRDNISADIVSFDIPNMDKENIALIFNNNDKAEIPNVRLHSECLTGDVFGSQRCDCNSQLNKAIDNFSEEGGIILYLRQEGRGIGLYNKLDAYKLQIEQNINTYEANCKLGFADDIRDYSNASKMLKALNIEKINLMTNNPDKVNQLQNNSIDVIKQTPTSIMVTPDNENYLKAKKIKGHNICLGKGGFGK